MILILGSFMAVSLVWTMNYLVTEEKMQDSRKMREQFETFLSSLRHDLQDGYQCSRMLAGQPFPHWDNLLAAGGNETEIQIRNFRWRDQLGNPVTLTLGAGTNIPQLGVNLRSVKVRRGFIRPTSGEPPIPTFREQKFTAPFLTPQELWGQDRWYRAMYLPTAGPNGALTNYISDPAAGSGIPGKNPSVYGMIFAAEIIIEPIKMGAGTGINNTLFFMPRNRDKPQQRIQIYLKAARELGAIPAQGTILGCYGPSTPAQLCDKSGGSFYTFAIPGAFNPARYYCHPDQYCWTQRIGGLPMFNDTPAELAQCAFPFSPQLVGDFSPSGKKFTCSWCNQNVPNNVPADIHYKPQLAPTANPVTPAKLDAQWPNVFGNSPSGAAGDPYF